MPRRLAAIALLLLALAPALRLLWLSRDGPHLGFYHDDGLYWVTAKSVAGGGGYRIPSLPGQPHQTKYPPVFPLILSAAWAIAPEFPSNLTLAACLTWLPLPLILWLTNALLASWGIGGGVRALLCAATALSPYLAFFGTTLMSEGWAAVFVLASLLYASRARARPQGLSPALWSGLFAAAAYLTKTLCAPLLVAVPLALSNHRRRVAFLCCALPPVLAWHAWAAAHRAPAPDWTWLYYLDYLGFYRNDIPLSLLPQVAYTNLGDLFTSGGDLLIFKASMTAGGEYLARLIMLIALAGVVRWTRASRRLEYPLFAAGSMALLLIWNFPPNERFLLPLLPLLLLGLWAELSHLGRIGLAAWRRPAASSRIAAAVAGLLLAAFAAGFAARNLYASWSFLPRLAEQRRAATAQAQPLYAWVRAHTPPNATFFADRDTAFYLYTGRQATAMRLPMRWYYTGESSAILAQFEKLTTFAAQRRLDYLFLTPSDFQLDALPREQWRALHQALARDTRYRVVHETPSGAVFQRHHPPKG